MELDLVGTLREQAAYCVSVLNDRFTLGNAWPAVTKAIKSYSFIATLEAVKSLPDATDSNLYAKVNFYSQSYYICNLATTSTEKQKEYIQKAQVHQAARKLASDPIKVCFNLWMDGLINQKQYQDALKDKELAKSLAKEMASGGR